MSRYYTDFSEYPTGSFPNGADWTVEYDAGATESIVSDTSAVGDKLLEIDQTTQDSIGAHALSWDGKNGSDVEIVAKVRPVDFTQLRLFVRGSGTSSNRNGYYISVDDTDFSISKYVDDSPSSIATSSHSFSGNQDVHWIRFRVNGDNIYGKVWKDGNTEPSSWGISTSDTSLSTGWTGVYTFGDSQICQYETFGVATNGDTAPKEPIDSFTSSGEYTYDVSSYSSIKVTVNGAAGGEGNSGNANGGNGGQATGTIDVSDLDSVQIFVGGGGEGSSVNAGDDGTGGFNGGGNADEGRSNDIIGGGGGGASEIRETSSLGTPSDHDRIIVAGGGGGGGYQSGDNGGAGGGTNGEDGTNSGSPTTGCGADQTSGNAFLQGYDANGDDDSRGGGGGGWYGGGTAGFDAGGCGGSGYTGSSRLSETSMTVGGGATAPSSDGSVVIESVEEGSSSTETIDDFEHNDLTGVYSGDTGDFNIQTGTVQSGTYALEASGNQTGNIHIRHDGSYSGLNTPEAGETFEFWVYPTHNGGRATFFGSGAFSSMDGYAIEHIAADQGFYVQRIDNGSTTNLGSNFGTGNYENQWVRFEVVTDTSGNIDVSLYDSSGTQLGSTVSVNDTNYTSGEFGWFDEDSHTNKYDSAFITSPNQGSTYTRDLTETVAISDSVNLQNLSSTTTLLTDSNGNIITTSGGVAVSSTSSGSETSESISWSTSTDWDNSSSEIGVLHSNDAIEIAHGTGAEDNSLNEWTLNDTGAGQEISSTTVKSGSYSHRTYVDGGNGGVAVYWNPVFNGSTGWVEWYARVGSNSIGRYDLNSVGSNGSNQQAGALTFESGGSFGASDGEYWNASGPSYSIDTWYIFRLEWDDSTQTYDLTVWDEDKSNEVWSQTGLNYNGMSSVSTDGVCLSYHRVDDENWIDLAWTDQDIGRRLLEEVSLTTDTKSFGSSVQPDLQNLGYTLNGQTINLDVIGSPGTASEETNTVSLDGSNSYSITWSDSHTDFRVKARLQTSSKTSTPTLSTVELSG